MISNNTELSQINYFDQMPEELTNMVANHLDNRSFFRFSGTCKLFYQMPLLEVSKKIFTLCALLFHESAFFVKSF